jgi:serine/threonine-protein kinase
MAPEQALGGPVDRRADVWSVGSILYRELAGRSPYEGTLITTLRLLDSGRPPDPLPSHVHPSIAGVVRRALAYAPEDRYATASQLREAIEEAMIAARVPTSVADVAAFMARQLPECAEHRRQAMSVALTPGAVPGDVEGLLEPSCERLPDTLSCPTLEPDTLVAPEPVLPQPQPQPQPRSYWWLFTVAMVIATLAGLAAGLFFPLSR